MGSSLLTLTWLVLTYISLVFTACINNGIATSSPDRSSSSLSTSLTLEGTIHRTAAATERVNNLWCYACDTMDDGEDCVDVLQRNNSSVMRKCEGQEFFCMVKRFSYTTSTENSTSLPKMWSMDRRCAISCEPGCIIIGERTKLYACTSCCEESFCNTGRGAASGIFHREDTGIGTRVFWLAAPFLINISLMHYKKLLGQLQ
ncbi:CG3955, partial [Drosophila busckii]